MKAVPRRQIPVGLPGWIYLPASVGAALVVVPLVAILLRIDWPHFIPLISSESSRAALLLSLKTATASTALCVLLGVPMAIVLAAAVSGAFGPAGIGAAALVLPPVVGGIALLYTFGRQGLLGQHLEAFGIRIAFTTAAVVLAQSFVSLPFLVVSLEGPYVRPATSTRASPRCSVAARPPCCAPSRCHWSCRADIGCGAGLRASLGEFGATLTFAGSLQGVTRTLPLEIYLQRETDPDAAIALSLLLIVVAAAIVIASASRRFAGTL